jgi:hypothetical protein
MRASLLGAVLAACAAIGLAAQTSTDPRQDPGASSRMTSMTGCVVGTGTTADPFRLTRVVLSGTPAPSGSTGTTGSTASGAASTGSPTAGAAATSGTGAGTTYALTGIDMKEHVGEQVQVTGTLPTASSTTGSASTGGGASATGSPALPELRVVTVRAMGPCPQG